MATFQNPQRDLLRVCRIGRAQGLRGEVNVTSYTDSPTLRYAFGSRLLTHAGDEFIVASSRKFKDRWILLFEGVEDRTAAESLNGITLFFDRAGEGTDSTRHADSGDAKSDVTKLSAANPDGDLSDLGDSVDSGDSSNSGDSGDVYFDELIGLAAQLADGSPLGKVTDAIDRPGQPLLEITEPHGSVSLIPFVRQIVPTIDVERGFIILTPPDGLLQERP
jgi:16S rRNA processing protein RimM